MDLKILYEDNHLIAIDKEPGTLSQKDSSGAPSLIEYVKDYIKKKYDKPGAVFLGPVHRLDKPASGVMLFARTSKAAERLQKEFAARKVVKLYLALVENRKPHRPGTWIECEDRLVRKRGFSERAGAGSRNVKTAHLRFICLGSNRRYALLLVSLLTGRKHQIRAQLAAEGTPVVGDATYGARESLPRGAICLHAHFLKFTHPTRREQIEIVSPVPERISHRLSIDDDLLSRIESEIRTSKPG
ncbi:MAG: RNA pseudouridine synthase [Spirochaetes bacterium]|nr:RNA pseudouridine synthase [Spirochaetota bacterium]